MLRVAPETVFNVASVSVMPFYFCMMAFPRAKLTERVMQSLWVAPVFALSYVCVLVHCVREGLLGKLLSVLQTSWPIPNIAAFSTLLMEPWCTVLTWLNLLIMDFYQARSVFLEGLALGVATHHSVFLCFMFGPLGLLSHHLTRRWTPAPASELESQLES